MIFSQKIKTFILLIGDWALFYFGLYLALTIRHQTMVTDKIWNQHQIPFFFIHILWLLIFYLHDLYDIKSFTALKIMIKRVVQAVATITVLTAAIFYLIPSLIITPKTNLFIDVIIVTGLLILWRRIFWHATRKGSKIKTLFFGTTKEVENLTQHLKNNSQIGYEPTMVLSEVDHNLIPLIKEHKIQLVVASKNIMYSENATKRFYESLSLGVSIMDFSTFYEMIFGKIPVSIINETWFLENLIEINKKAFEIFKRVFDFIFSILLILPTLLLIPLIALAIKTESRGSVFYRQKRIGKYGKVFKIIKFRSMEKGAEKDGIKWAKEKDPRITRVGNFLRKTRLDELPQLWNILRGELSFVGPRPERPEFIEELVQKIPHYSMRHIIKPGLSGWAQINFPYGASVEDTMEKLQYDLFYIKNRSAVLDLSIFFKTLLVVLRHSGR